MSELMEQALDRISTRRISNRGRATMLLGWWGFVAALAALFPSFGQPASYHGFADARVLLGVPHFGDVVSNLGFGLVGLAGLTFVALRGRALFDRPSDALPYLSFFGGLVLVSIGSGYYHWAPSDATLFWDRVSMSVVFMSLVAIVLADRVDRRWAVTRGLPLLIVIGFASVLAWRLSGDIRPYLFGCQLAPFGTIVFAVFVLYRRRGRLDNRGFAALAGFYGLAVLFEASDHALFSASGGVVSGHTLKHLFAALGVGCVLWMLRRTAPAHARVLSSGHARHPSRTPGDQHSSATPSPG